MEALPVKVQSFLEVIDIEADDCLGVIIDNDEQMGIVSNALRSLKTRMKEVDKQRLEITRPIDASKDRIMALFRPYEQKLKKAETAIKSAILEYQKKIEQDNKRRQEEENRRVAEATARQQAAIVSDAERAIEDGKPELAVAYLNKAEAITIKPVDVAKERRPTGISIPKIWKHKVIDESKIPDEFWVLDEKRLAAYAKSMKEKSCVPGVEFYEEAIVSARGL